MKKNSATLIDTIAMECQRHYNLSKMANVLRDVPAQERADNCRFSMGGLEDFLPSGAGFDNGTDIVLERSGLTQVFLTTSFHHMNDVGFYTQWSSHDVIIRPRFGLGFEITVRGRNVREIKDYIADTFTAALRQRVCGEWNMAKMVMEYELVRD